MTYATTHITTGQLALTLRTNAGLDLALRLTDADGVPVDVTGAAGAAQVRTRPGGDLLAEATVTVGTTDGLVRVTIDDASTVTLSAGWAVWDLVVTGGPWEEAAVLLAGPVEIIEGVTV